MRIGSMLGLACALACVAPAPADAVVGGEPARGDFPFFTQLVINGKTECGGSLVRPQWVLTAAHCVVGLEPHELELIVGSKVREEGTRVGMKRAEVHPGFRAESIAVLKAAWDVAVVELERPVDAAPIGFADPALFAPGATASAIGLGADGFAIGSYRDELYQATLPIVSDEDCGRVYAGRYDPDQHICAGTFENEENVCQGDSGGPLMVRDGASAWALVGVVSFGTGCATPGTYNVFARAAGPVLRQWIEARLPHPSPAAPVAPPPSGGGRTTAPAAARPPAHKVRITIGRVRAGARSVRVRVSGSARITIHDARGRLLGRAVATRPGTVAVRLRRALRRGRITVRAGAARRLVRVG